MLYQLDNNEENVRYINLLPTAGWSYKEMWQVAERF
jgi:hypothetical protein